MPSFWKEPRAAIDRLARRKRSAADEDRERARVRTRDRCRCRVCGRSTRVVHEEKRRGAGGVVSLTNSYCACDVIDGGLCHPLLQTRWIYPVMANGQEAFDASEELLFEMSEGTAKRVFFNRQQPAHVRIVEDAR